MAGVRGVAVIRFMAVSWASSRYTPGLPTTIPPMSFRAQNKLMALNSEEVRLDGFFGCNLGRRLCHVDIVE